MLAVITNITALAGIQIKKTRPPRPARMQGELRRAACTGAESGHSGRGNTANLMLREDTRDVAIVGIDHAVTAIVTPGQVVLAPQRQ